MGEMGREKGKEGRERGKGKGGMVGKRGKNEGKGKNTQKKNLKQYQKCFKKLRGGLEVYLLRAQM